MEQESKFKAGDCAQLIHGESNRMTVGEIDFDVLADVTRIKCTWFEKGKLMEHKFIETQLKHCPKEPTQSDIKRANEMLNQTRR